MRSIRLRTKKQIYVAMKGIGHISICSSFFLSTYTSEKIGWMPRLRTSLQVLQKQCESTVAFSLFSFSFQQAYILSSHRSYVMRADTYELSDGLVGKGEAITLFLFNDSLEVRFLFICVYNYRKWRNNCNREKTLYAVDSRWLVTSTYK